jgi:hypothetical protein
VLYTVGFMAFICLDGSEFTTDSDESFDQFTQDLPWGNKWVKTNKELNDLLPVLGVLQFTSGLMIVTKYYKAFLKPGENGFSHLQEALEVWSNMKSPTNTLYCTVTSKGFPKLAVNDEHLNRGWANYGDRWIQHFERVVSRDSVKKVQNPLLAGEGGTDTFVEQRAGTSRGRK